MRVGIIGGNGRMGTLFAGVFRRAGHTVETNGRSGGRPNSALAKDADLVIVSVPIRSTVEVIRTVGPLLTGSQVFCDLTSLKEAPVRAMLESEAQVVGLHPMFGPGLGSIREQTIIATPARCSTQALSCLVGIFEGEGARVTITTPENHDRIMAIVQGLTHFVTLAIAETMQSVGTDPAETRDFMSPVYQIEMGLVGRLLSQNPDLYADIIQLNPHVPAVLSACEESIGRLRAAASDDGPASFVRMFEKNAAYFGPFCRESAELTDRLIRCMVER